MFEQHINAQTLAPSRIHIYSSQTQTQNDGLMRVRLCPSNTHDILDELSRVLIVLAMVGAKIDKIRMTHMKKGWSIRINLKIGINVRKSLDGHIVGTLWSWNNHIPRDKAVVRTQNG